MKINTDNAVALKNATAGAMVIQEGSTRARSTSTCTRKDAIKPVYPPCPPAGLWLIGDPTTQYGNEDSCTQETDVPLSDDEPIWNGFIPWHDSNNWQTLPQGSWQGYSLNIVSIYFTAGFGGLLITQDIDGYAAYFRNDDPDSPLGEYTAACPTTIPQTYTVSLDPPS